MDIFFNLSTRLYFPIAFVLSFKLDLCLQKERREGGKMLWTKMQQGQFNFVCVCFEKPINILKTKNITIPG